MDRHTRREFLRRGAVAGVVIAGVPVVRTFDVAAFGQAGSSGPVTQGTQPTDDTVPDVRVEGASEGAGQHAAGVAGGTGGSAGSGGGLDPGRLPFTGGDPVALGTVGAATVTAGGALVASHRRPQARRVGRTGEPRGHHPLARLDGVLWVYESPAHSALGYPFTVRATDARLGRHVERLLAPFRATGASPLAAHRLSLRDRGAGIQPRFAAYADERLLAADADPSLVLGAVLSTIDRGVVAGAAATHLLVHGAAAGASSGSVLLVGPSGTGKTTLVGALVRSGLGYVADEIVAFAPGSTVAACYQKPISLEGAARFVSGNLRDVAAVVPGVPSARWHVSAETLRAGALGTPAPVRAVFAVRYEAGRAAALEPMSESDALTLLVSNSFNGDRLDDVAFATASAIAADAAAYRLSFGDLDAACTAVRDVLGA